MAFTVRFMWDDGEEHYELENVPVPPMGSRIEFDGKGYTVGKVVITYWSSDIGNSTAWVNLTSDPVDA